MVAFELAQFHEKIGANIEAVRWYTSAAERFRRAQWKQKAEEALTRLGAPIPAALPPTMAATSASETTQEPAAQMEPIIAEFSESQVSETSGEINGEHQESVFEPQAATAATSTPGADAGHRRKRRGRRGGRGRNKGARTGAAATASAPHPVPVPPSAFDRAAEPRSIPAARHLANEEFAQPRLQEPESVRSIEPVVSGSAFQ